MTQCQCKSNFQTQTDNTQPFYNKCVIIVTDPNAHVDPTDPTKAVCNTGFHTDGTLNLCVKTCTADTYTKADFDPDNVKQCLCQTNYIWNVGKDKCVRICPYGQ